MILTKFPLPMKKSLPKILQLKNIAFIFLVFLAGLNCYYTFVYIMVKYQANEEIAEPGAQFGDMRNILKGVKRVGFLTNKDLSREQNDGEYLQAQYYLAPTLLELNNSSLKYSILDFTNQIFVFYTLEKEQLKPIYDTKYSKVLTEKIK